MTRTAKRGNPLKHKWAAYLATLGPVGYWTKAPGTLGSLAALPLVWGLHQWTPLVQMILVWAVVLVTLICAEIHESVSENHDAKEVVIDEVAGMAVTFIWVPLSAFSLLCGFFLFRLFDVWKPFPIGWLDRHVKGGTGVVVDDLVAGILANIGLHLLGAQLNWTDYL